MINMIVNGGWGGIMDLWYIHSGVFMEGLQDKMLMTSMYTAAASSTLVRTGDWVVGVWFQRCYLQIKI
jgi:hypothetical protein